MITVMKKLMIAFVFLSVITINTNAYGSGFGIRGGLNFSSISSDEVLSLSGNYGGTITALSDNYTGFHFGVVGYFSLLNIFIQPELLYTQTGQKMAIKHMDTSPDIDYFTNKYSHISIPVLAGPRFGPLRFGLGPVFSFLLDSTQGYDLYMEDELDFDHNRATVGYQVLLGLKARNFLIDFKYEGNLSKLSSGVSIGDTSFDFDTRPRQFILSVGILLN